MGLSGFGYPASPVPFTLNVVSKILAFAVALSLFLPQRARASTPGPALGRIGPRERAGPGETGSAAGS
jgi:hypothetical protein